MGFDVCEIPGKERSHGSCLPGKQRLSLFSFLWQILQTQGAQNVAGTKR